MLWTKVVKYTAREGRTQSPQDLDGTFDGLLLKQTGCLLGAHLAEFVSLLFWRGIF
jgi:hypothetical protein